MTDTVFVGRVLRAEPKSFEEAKQRLLNTLPRELAEQLDENWSPEEMRQALRYLLPQSEYASLGETSDDEIRRVFERKFLTRRVHILVTEPFRGIEEQEVEFSSDLSDCSVDFQENESYLIYAWRDKDTGQFGTAVCAGTNRVDRVPDQLKYIRGLKIGETLSRIFGFVTRDPSNIQFPVRASKPVPDVPIVLQSGGKSWRTVTDPEGKYELTSVSSGAYDIAAAVRGVPTEQTLRSFELVAGACSRHNFLAVPIGSISGRLLDSEGAPISGVLVALEAVPPTKQPGPLVQNFTDEEGRFEHTQLEAGEYVLGFNLERPPNARDWYGKRIPYPRSYYPGVTDRSAAHPRAPS